jgi:hypothetical protein
MFNYSVVRTLFGDHGQIKQLLPAQGAIRALCGTFTNTFHIASGRVKAYSSDTGLRPVEENSMQRVHVRITRQTDHGLIEFTGPPP